MIITIDTGGTKTLLALFSDEGSIIKSHKFPTPTDQNQYLEELPRELSSFIEGVDLQQVRALTLACPGLIKDNVIVWGGGNLQWKDVRVAEVLAPLLPAGTPILAENDATLGGLGETRALETQPRMSLYITISTGIGVGAITDGHINPHLANNEAGHMLLEHEGTLQRWEVFGSGKAIKNMYGKFASEIDDPATWRDITDRMSRGFLTLIPTLQPDIIIIGGSIGTHFAKYGEYLQSLLRERLDPNIPMPLIVQARDPEEAVVYGAYYHALDHLAQR